MKIENNGISALNPQGTDPSQRVENKQTGQEIARVAQRRDSVAVSENARLLVKARAAVENADEVENERLELLRNQIESGDYTVQVEEIARKLAGQYQLRT